MTAACFVDTNVFIYARDPRVPVKQQCAAELIHRLWLDRAGRTSMQVLNEFYVTVTRKLNPSVDAETAWDEVLALTAWNPQPTDRELLKIARDIERRYRTNWWDALIVAAAQAQQCTLLISEDFQDGMGFGQVTVRNPFTSGVAEAAVEYAAVQPRAQHRSRGRPRKASRANQAVEQRHRV
jgi:predicted nucleic acid-binding protein